MPSNSSFPPLVAKHINISKHSSMLVKRCRGASSEQRVLEAAVKSQLLGCCTPQTPQLQQPSLRENQVSPLAVPNDFPALPYPKILPPSIPPPCARQLLHGTTVGWVFFVAFEFAAGNLSWIQTGDLDVKGSIARY